MLKLLQQPVLKDANGSYPTKTTGCFLLCPEVLNHSLASWGFWETLHLLHAEDQLPTRHLHLHPRLHLLQQPEQLFVIHHGQQ